MIPLLLLLTLSPAWAAPVAPRSTVPDISTPLTSFELHSNDTKKIQFMNNILQSLQNMHSDINKIMPDGNLENLKCEFVTTNYNDSDLTSFRFRNLKGKLYPNRTPMYSDKKEGNVGPKKYIEIHFVDMDSSSNSRRVAIQLPNNPMTSSDGINSKKIDTDHTNSILANESIVNYAEYMKNNKSNLSIDKKNNTVSKTYNGESNQSKDTFFYNESMEENTTDKDDNHSSLNHSKSTSDINTEKPLITNPYSEPGSVEETTTFPSSTLVSLNNIYNSNNTNVNGISKNILLNNSMDNQNINNTHDVLESTTALESAELVDSTTSAHSPSYNSILAITERLNSQDKKIVDSNSHNNYTPLSGLTEHNELSIEETTSTESMIPTENFTVVNITEIITQNSNVSQMNLNMSQQENWTSSLHLSSNTTTEANMHTKSTDFFLTTEERAFEKNSTLDSADRIQIDHTTDYINRDVDEKNLSNTESTTNQYSYFNTLSTTIDPEENNNYFTSENRFNYSKSIKNINLSHSTKEPGNSKNNEYTNKNFTLVGNMWYHKGKKKNQHVQLEETTKSSNTLSVAVNGKGFTYEAPSATTESNDFKMEATLNIYENVKASSDSPFDITTVSTTENIRPQFSGVTSDNELVSLAVNNTLKSESLITTQPFVNQNYNITNTTSFQDFPVTKTSAIIENKSKKDVLELGISTVHTTSDTITDTTLEFIENSASTFSSKSSEFSPTEESNSAEINLQHTTKITFSNELNNSTDITNKTTLSTSLNDYYTTIPSTEIISNKNITTETISDREGKSILINIANETTSTTDLDKSTIVYTSSWQTTLTTKSTDEAGAGSTTHRFPVEPELPESTTVSKYNEKSTGQTTVSDELNPPATTTNHFVNNSNSNHPDERNNTKPTETVTQYRHKPTTNYEPTLVTDTSTINIPSSSFQSTSDQTTKALNMFDISTQPTKGFDTETLEDVSNIYTTTPEVDVKLLETTYMKLNDPTTEKHAQFIKDPKGLEATVYNMSNFLESEQESTTQTLNYTKEETTASYVDNIVNGDTSSSFHLFNNKSLDKSTRGPRLLPTRQTNWDSKRTTILNFPDFNPGTTASIFPSSSDKIISSNSSSSVTSNYNTVNVKIDSQVNNHTSQLVTSSDVVNTTPHYFGDPEFNNFTFYLPTTEHRTLFVPLQFSVKSFKPLI